MTSKTMIYVIAIIFTAAIFSGCGHTTCTNDNKPLTKEDSIMKSKIDQYATVQLTTDMSKISDKEKELISVLIDIAQIMDELFWDQTFGNKQVLFDSLSSDYIKRFATINYGPWERLNNNISFIEKYGERPLGANYYPADMTKEEFEEFENADKLSLYTLLRRDEAGSLKVVWYHEAYKEQLQRASDLMKKAAELASDEGLKKYLQLRAEALLTSDYQLSDMTWMDMKDNHIDFVVGPIENYDDGLYEYKASFEAFVLVKDMEWSNRLKSYVAMLPELQKSLPVPDKYKKEIPGTSSDLGVYDAVYYAGDCNSGSKTIAINLPNDEDVQKLKGSRRLQLKNTMKAKFDGILMPIAQKLIDPQQLQYIKFDAFFNNVMFHEVGHGLGIKQTVNGKGTVREALKDVYSAIEEAKADILGLYLVTKMIEKGDIKDISAEDCYVTFMAGIFRSVRFGAASSHGKANMMCFNFFEDNGAFAVNADGTYKVDFIKMKEASDKWAATILTFQGEGDYEGVSAYINENAIIRDNLQKELNDLQNANIPIDVVFEQGKDILGIK